MKKPLVAIIGRPNVGKSTLFNRLVSKRVAIVDDKPGVTRDRLYADAEWLQYKFLLVDTGGLVPDSDDWMEQNINIQVEVAVTEADIILFVVDARAGLATLDEEISVQLQKVEKPIILVINKADSDSLELSGNDFYQLGMGDPFAISAMEGRNIGDLLDKITGHFKTLSNRDLFPDAIKIALVGKPNVGKSSLLNALMGEERVIVDAKAGTTRDSIDTHFTYYKQNFIITDTAGMRNKSRIDEDVEFFSSVRSLRSIKRCDVAVVLTDAKEGLTRQDLRVMEVVIEAGKGVMLCINKWDLVKDKNYETHKNHLKEIKDKLGKYYYIPIEFISVKERQRIINPIKQAIEIYKRRSTTIITSRINKVLEKMCSKRSFFTSQGKEIKINYTTQVSNDPPTFVLFTNQPKGIKEVQKKFIIRNIREAFDFTGTPIRLLLREKH